MATDLKAGVSADQGIMDYVPRHQNRVSNEVCSLAAIVSTSALQQMQNIVLIQIKTQDKDVHHSHCYLY